MMIFIKVSSFRFSVSTAVTSLFFLKPIIRGECVLEGDGRRGLGRLELARPIPMRAQRGVLGCGCLCLVSGDVDHRRTGGRDSHSRVPRTWLCVSGVWCVWACWIPALAATTSHVRLFSCWRRHLLGRTRFSCVAYLSRRHYVGNN